MAGALANVEEGFLSGGEPPGMGLRARVVDGAEDEVEEEEQGYKQGLPDRRDDA